MMALIRFTFVIPDEVDPFDLASGLDRKTAFGDEDIAQLMTVDYKIPFKRAWHTVVIECDTCGDLVDQRTDPLFRKHNDENYERHVEISRSDPDYPNVPRLF